MRGLRTIATVGEGLRVTRGGNIPKLILRDEFTDNRAAGAIHQTKATDGVSVRNVMADIDGSVSIADGQLKLIPQSTNTNDWSPFLFWPPVLRSPAKILIARVYPCIGGTTNDRGPSQLGFANAYGGSLYDHAFRFIWVNAKYLYNNGDDGGNIAGGNAINQQQYDLAIILKTAGAEYWIRGDPWLTWTLAYTDTTMNSPILYPMWANGRYQLTNLNQMDFLRVYTYTGGEPQKYFDLDPAAVPMARTATKSVWFYGDSKTNPSNVIMHRATTDVFGAFEVPASVGHGGNSVVDQAAAVDADLAATVGTPDLVGNNLGVNGLGTVNETDFKTAYQAIIDKEHAKWGSAKIYLARIWKRGAVAADITNVNTWINDLIAANPGVCYAGPDETVWLEGGDDGATMSSDGTHYSSPTGLNECARQWRTAFGY